MALLETSRGLVLGALTAAPIGCFLGGIDALGHPCTVDADCGPELVCGIDSGVCEAIGDESSGSATSATPTTSGSPTATGMTTIDSDDASGSVTTDDPTSATQSTTESDPTTDSDPTTTTDSDPTVGSSEESSTTAAPCGATVDAITPELGIRSVEQNVVIQGAGFTDVESVSIGGVPLAIVQISETEITATLPIVGDQQGPVDVVVATMSCDAVLEAGYRFVNDVPSFAPGPANELTATLGAPGEATLALADMDGDGALDVVVGTALPGTVSVWKNDGTGTFDEPLLEDFVHAGGSLGLGDVDEDGELDIVTSNGQDLFYFTSELGFGAPLEMSTNLTEVRGLTVFDADGAGGLDVVVRGSDGGNPVARVVTTTGNDLAPFELGESLSAEVAGAVSLPPSPPAIGNFDGMGGLDLAIPIASTPRLVGFVHGGNSTYLPGDVEPALFNITTIVQILVDNLDGGGRDELFYAGEGPNMPSYGFGVIDGNGFGAVAVARSLPGTPVAITSADFNADGTRDIAVANSSASIEVLPLVGGALVGAVTDIPFGANQADIAAGDVDRDGMVDLVVVRRTDPVEVVVLRNTSADAE